MNRCLLSRNSFLAIIVLFSAELRSQGQGFVYGNITPAEIAMTHYTPDSSASAVVLNEFGEVYFDSNNMFVEIHQKIKVLKTEGLRQANIQIPLYRGYYFEEKIKSFEGISFYLENGKIRNSFINNNAIFYEKNEGYSLAKITIPNVRVGSVFEIRYVLQCLKRSKLFPWKFQSDIPKVKSEFWILLTANRYNISLQGLVKLSFKESTIIKNCDYPLDCNLHKFRADSIPAFKEEEFISDASNYISKLNFRTAFDVIVLEKHFKNNKFLNEKVLEARNALKKDLVLTYRGVTDSLEKAKNIYNWIKTALAVDEGFYQSIYPNNDPKKTYERKTGSESDINLCLMGALQEAGFKASFVILSTRENGLPNDFNVVFTDCNHLIVQLFINGNSYLLDATDDLLPFGFIPKKCINGKGKAMKQKLLDIDLSANAKTRSVTTLNLKVNDDCSLAGSVQLNHSGYGAIDKRKSIKSFSGLSAYQNTLAKNWVASEIKKYEVQNLEDIEKPLIEKMDLSFEPSQINNPTQIYFNPFLKGQWEQNPFKSTERNYPVDFGMTQEEIFLISLEFPSNFHLEDIPKNIVLSLPNKGGKLSFNYANVGNKINITYTLNLTKAVYSPEEYYYLRELFSQLIQIRQTDLVLIKNK